MYEVQKDPESKKSIVKKIKNRKIMLSSNSKVCGSRKSRFIKEQEVSGLKLTALFGFK